MNLRNTTARPLHGHTLVALSAQLDVATASATRGKLLGYLQHGGRWLIIDLSGVNYCDVFGLAVLLVTDRRARLLGGGLRLAAPTAVATEALCVSGLHRHFAIYPTPEAAVADHDRLARQRVARA